MLTPSPIRSPSLSSAIRNFQYCTSFSYVLLRRATATLMGDGVSIAARGPEAWPSLAASAFPEDAYPPCKSEARSRGHRSRSDAAQEHCRADAGSIRLRSASPAWPKPAKPLELVTPVPPKKRSALAPLAMALAALLVLIGGSRVVAAQCEPARGRRLRKPAEVAQISIVGMPSSPTSPTILRKTISPTASPRISPPNCRVYTTVSSSPATPLSRFKGKNLDAKAIGKELGVRYVLEGSVQRSANRVRVNAQLIDAGDPARMSGRIDSRKMSWTSSSSRTKWWRASPARFRSSW